MFMSYLTCACSRVTIVFLVLHFQLIMTTGTAMNPTTLEMKTVLKCWPIQNGMICLVTMQGSTCARKVCAGCSFCYELASTFSYCFIHLMCRHNVWFQLTFSVIFVMLFFQPRLPQCKAWVSVSLFAHCVLALESRGYCFQSVPAEKNILLRKHEFSHTSQNWSCSFITNKTSWSKVSSVWSMWCWLRQESRQLLQICIHNYNSCQCTISVQTRWWKPCEHWWPRGECLCLWTYPVRFLFHANFCRSKWFMFCPKPGVFSSKKSKLVFSNEKMHSFFCRTGTAWIGYTDVKVEGIFEWTDQCPCEPKLFPFNSREQNRNLSILDPSKEKKSFQCCILAADILF